jgi:hypothetical protein
VNVEPPVSLDAFAGEDSQAIREGVFQCLRQGCLNRQSPFHTLSLATVDADGGPEVRTVVFRGLDVQQRQVRMHTDLRSPKVVSLQRDPRATLLWYAPEWKLQVRARASVAVHHADEVAAAYWESSHPRSRRVYNAPYPPGAPTPHAVTDIAPHLLDAVVTMENTAAGFGTFAVMLATITRLEWLMLYASGNRRGCFHWQDAAWRHQWLAP